MFLLSVCPHPITVILCLPCICSHQHLAVDVICDVTKERAQTVRSSGILHPWEEQLIPRLFWAEWQGKGRTGKENPGIKQKWWCLSPTHTTPGNTVNPVLWYLHIQGIQMWVSIPELWNPICAEIPFQALLGSQLPSAGWQSRIILETATIWPLFHCFIQKVSAVLVVPPSAQHVMVFPNGEKIAGNMQECYRQ